jgi:hypothetical protein
MEKDKHKKRPYPHKPEKEKRIPVTFPLSGETLKEFREIASIEEAHELTNEEIIEKARDLAYQAIGAYIKRHREYNDAIIV